MKSLILKPFSVFGEFSHALFDQEHGEDECLQPICAPIHCISLNQEKTKKAQTPPAPSSVQG